MTFPRDLISRDLISRELAERISSAGVMVLATVDRADDAVPLAKALMACGVRAIQVSLRTGAAMDAIAKIRESVPECLVGAASIFSEDQLADAKRAGADFGTSTGFSGPVVSAAQEIRFPFIPGVMTPSEIETAVAAGCHHLQLFPAEPIGGLDYFRAVRESYSHLGIKYVIGGGVSVMHVRRYLSDADVIGIAGEWIAPRRIIQNQNWSAVIDQATEVVGIMNESNLR